MDYHDDIEEFGDKLHNGAVFICQLIRAGSKNAAKTHRILKAGITILFVALVLYLIGFISPYWVVGDNHAHTHHGTGNGTRAFHLSDFHRNDTHFGLWQECVVFDGRSFCTLFTDDIGEQLGRTSFLLPLPHPPIARTPYPPFSSSPRLEERPGTSVFFGLSGISGLSFDST